MPDQSGEDRYYEAAGTGIASYVFGYGITYLLKSGEARQAVLDPGGIIGPATPDPPGTWQMVAWLFYGMHNVDAAISISGGSRSVTRELQMTGAGPVFESWLLLIPAVLLIFGGYVHADDFIGTNPTLLSGAKEGATIVVGYLPVALVVAGASVWQARIEQIGGAVEVAVGPEIVEAALVAGIAYPIILGAVGGVVAAREHRGGDTERSEF